MRVLLLLIKQRAERFRTLARGERQIELVHEGAGAGKVCGECCGGEAEGETEEGEAMAYGCWVLSVACCVMAGVCRMERAHLGTTTGHRAARRSARLLIVRWSGIFTRAHDQESCAPVAGSGCAWMKRVSRKKAPEKGGQR